MDRRYVLGHGSNRRNKSCYRVDAVAGGSVTSIGCMGYVSHLLLDVFIKW